MGLRFRFAVFFYFVFSLGNLQASQWVNLVKKFGWAADDALTVTQRLERRALTTRFAMEDPRGFRSVLLDHGAWSSNRP